MSFMNSSISGSSYASLTPRPTPLARSFAFRLRRRAARTNAGRWISYPISSVQPEDAFARGTPKSIARDNGSEFTGRAMDTWAHTNGIALDVIRPGKPQENAFIESFNGKFREEFLSENWFVSLEDARWTIEEWRLD